VLAVAAAAALAAAALAATRRRPVSFSPTGVKLLGVAGSGHLNAVGFEAACFKFRVVDFTALDLVVGLVV
jgi:hypothetical protein